MGSLCCAKRVWRVVVRRVSLVVMSVCYWGVKPARVMPWRQMAIVMASGLLVKTEQLLQQRRVPRQYLVMVPVTLPTVRLEEQTMHLSCVGLSEACMVVIGLWRWRVEHGAHHVLLTCEVQACPRMSKDPQLKQEGGAG